MIMMISISYNNKNDKNRGGGGENGAIGLEGNKCDWSMNVWKC